MYLMLNLIHLTLKGNTKLRFQYTNSIGLIDKWIEENKLDRFQTQGERKKRNLIEEGEEISQITIQIKCEVTSPTQS